MGEDARTFTDEDLSGATFRGVDLSRASFRGADLSKASLRGVAVDGLEIDSPWLLEEPGTLVVNGVDVAPLVDAELDRRFPGRALRRAQTPEELREAWAAVESAWAAATTRAEGMPPGTTDLSVAGEWSFAQTLRHLVMATDTWLLKAVHGVAQPYHPAGLPDASFALDGGDTSVFANPEPTWAEVLQARADRQRRVRAALAEVTAEQLAQERPNPHAPAYPETVLSCLRTILEEEWEHLRFATRDLDAIERGEG